MGSRTDQIIKGKIQKVDQLSESIQNFGSFLIFEYLGLDSEEISELRKKFRESESKLMIQENNILNRALKKMNLKDDVNLSGPNAILLTKQQLKPFQDIVKLSKDKEFIRLKMAYFDNALLENEDLKLLENLSSKEDLIAKFSRMLLMPLYKFTNSIKKISN